MPLSGLELTADYGIPHPIIPLPNDSRELEKFFTIEDLQWTSNAISWTASISSRNVSSTSEDEFNSIFGLKQSPFQMNDQPDEIHSQRFRLTTERLTMKGPDFHPSCNQPRYACHFHVSVSCISDRKFASTSTSPVSELTTVLSDQVGLYSD